MFWFLVFILIFVYLVKKVQDVRTFWKDRGIQSLPYFLGSDNIIKKRPLGLVSKLWYDKYPNEKCVGLFSMMRPVLMLRDPEMIKMIAIKEFDHNMNHRVILKEDFAPLFGKNLVSLEGHRWKNMRSTLSPAFTSSKMRILYVLIKNCANQFSKYFMEEAQKNNGKIEMEMKDTFSRYTNDIIATSAFGIEVDSLKNKENEFFMSGKKVTTFTWKASFKVIGYMIMMPVMKFFNVKLMGEDMETFFRTIVKSTIDMREKEGIIRPDMIHLLMEARKGKLKHDDKDDNVAENETGFATVEESNIGKEEKKNNSILSDDDITAQAILFFIAGYETASTLMTFLSYELALNPDIQKRIQAEVDETMQKCNGDIDYESLLKMKYLDMIISEALRKWPPAVLTDRVSLRNQKITIDDKTISIKENLDMWIPIFAIQNDPKYFPNPEKFDPERFNDENKKNISPLTYMPFGVGPRNCIGSRFALLEIKALYVHLLSKFDICVVEKTQIPLKSSWKRANMLPDDGIWLGFKPRETSDL